MVNESALPQILNVLRRRRRLVITMALTGAALAGIVGVLIPPRYTAKAEIVVDPKPAMPAAGQLIVSDSPMNESAVQTTVAALTSRDHVQRVLDSLERDTQSRSNHSQSVNPPSGLSGMRDWALVWLHKWWSATAIPAFNYVSRLMGGHDSGAKFANNAAKPNVDAFERHLAVFQERGSHVLAVTFTSTSASEAARVANRVVQVYMHGAYQEQQESTNRTLAWVNKRLPQLRAQLEHAETAAQTYRMGHGLVQGNQTDLTDQKLGDLNRQLTAAESTLADHQARLATIRQLRRTGSTIDTLAQTLDTPSLRQLRNREAVLLQAQAELTATLGQLHPRTQAIAAQLREARGRIVREVGHATDELADEVKIAAAQVGLLQGRVAVAKQTSNEAQMPAAHLRDLERSATTIRQLYESFLQRREQLLDQREMISPDVRILSLAVPPDRPSSPNPLLFPLPALIAFAIGGGLIAVVKDRLDQGLRSIKDVNDQLGIPCMGLVPLIHRTSRKRPHQYLITRPFAPYAEAIRSVAASLQLAVPRPISEAILITSSVPQEGKTTLAVSLAAYAATLGRRTVLVDLDFRRPAIWHEIGGDRATNALELQDSGGRSSVALANVPALGFHVLALHPRPSDPLTAYASGQLTHLLDCLRASYDCVIIDSPPLLAVAETRLLAMLADKTVFVVKWGTTRRDVAHNALNLLHEACVPGPSCSNLICGVVTQVDLKKHAKYRYGDAAESYVRYARYYLRNPPSAGRHVAAALQLGGGAANAKAPTPQ